MMLILGLHLWISLNMKENILTDPEIPVELRDRIWSFVNGDLGVDPNTLPGDTVEWYKDKPTDSNCGTLL